MSQSPKPIVITIEDPRAAEQIAERKATAARLRAYSAARTELSKFSLRTRALASASELAPPVALP
jgi:hypothetical protein